MSYKLLLSAAVAVAIAGSATVAGAQERAGAKFITMAIQGNLAETQMGQLAQQNGQRPDVKSFGQALQQDHTKANQNAMAVAQQIGVTPPTEPTKKQKADFAKMSKMSGAAFDREFAKHMVMDHKKDIAAYQKQAKMTNDPTAAYASQTLPDLQKHLETAQSLAKGGQAMR